MGQVEAWDRRLLGVIEDWADVPFSWGKTDCVHFCIACERAVTGVSVFDGFPAYTTRAGGFRHIKKMGFETIADFLDSRLPAISPGLARRGDWVQMPENAGQAFGVCAGKRIAVKGPDGIGFFPAGIAIRAWRVG